MQGRRLCSSEDHPTRSRRGRARPVRHLYRATIASPPSCSGDATFRTLKFVGAALSSSPSPVAEARPPTRPLRRRRSTAGEQRGCAVWTRGQSVHVRLASTAVARNGATHREPVPQRAIRRSTASTSIRQSATSRRSTRISRSGCDRPRWRSHRRRASHRFAGIRPRLSAITLSALNILAASRWRMR